MRLPDILGQFVSEEKGKNTKLGPKLGPKAKSWTQKSGPNMTCFCHKKGPCPFFDLSLYEMDWTGGWGNTMLRSPPRPFWAFNNKGHLVL